MEPRFSIEPKGDLESFRSLIRVMASKTTGRTRCNVCSRLVANDRATSIIIPVQVVNDPQDGEGLVSMPVNCCFDCLSKVVRMRLDWNDADELTYRDWFVDAANIKPIEDLPRTRGDKPPKPAAPTVPSRIYPAHAGINLRDDIRDAIGLLESHGIPAMRSTDPDDLVFEVGESVFRALLPADPTHAASRLIEAVRNRGKILDGYRKTVAGLGRVEALEADDVSWDDLFSNGDPVETGAVIFHTQRGDEHPISLDLLIMSDGTWQPDGFDSDREGTAADVRGYLSQWTGDNR